MLLIVEAIRPADTNSLRKPLSALFVKGPANCTVPPYWIPPGLLKYFPEINPSLLLLISVYQNDFQNIPASHLSILCPSLLE